MLSPDQNITSSAGDQMGSNAAAALEALAKYFSLHTFDIGCSTKELKNLYALRYDIYCLECGFLAAEDYPDGLETDEFDRRSAHFSANNADGLVAGAVRLVTSEAEKPFPYLDHCTPFADFEPPPLVESGEISRLAVRREYRRRAGDSLSGVNESHLKGVDAVDTSPQGERRVNAPLLVLGLYREMYRYSCDKDIRYWYAAMEKKLARVLDLFGFHFTPIGPEQDYYGPVTPYLADLRKLEQDLEASNPALLWWFRSGP